MEIALLLAATTIFVAVYSLLCARAEVQRQEWRRESRAGRHRL